MKIVKTNDDVKIDPYKTVKLTNMGSIHEIMDMKVKPKAPPITKLNKHEYVLHETGEVLEYNHIENRSQSTDSLRKTFKKLRNLINTNFSGQPNELMVTITYAENMTDTKRLYTDFKKFMMKLKYKYQNLGLIDYISVVEPQGRGAWHCHILLKFTNKKTAFIPYKDLLSLWPHGNQVDIKKIDTKGVDNIGAYLSAYLGDIELGDDSLKELNQYELNKLDIKTVEIDGEKKKFIKGARLHLYPPGMNIYRKSKGIIEPIIEWIPYSDAIKKIGSPTTATYLSQITINDDNDENLNIIKYEFYNTRRK